MKPKVLLLSLLQSVMFHFDCIQTSTHADILLTLSSLPSPQERLGHVTRKITLEDDSRKRRFIELPIILRRPPSTPLPKLSIHYQVVDSTVNVSFEPLLPDILHRVCLIRDHRDFYCYMEKNLSQGVGNTTFNNVAPGNYSIMISRGIQESHFYKTSMFTVQATPLQDGNHGNKESSDSFIMIITLSCLGLITLTTTIVFWVIRKQICAERHSYDAGPQNNAKDDLNDGVPTIFPLMYPESDTYKKAVGDICSYLQAWGICNTRTEPFRCYHDNQISTLIDQSRGCHVIIFLSSHMVDILKDVHRDPNCAVPPHSSPHVRFLYQILKRTDLPEAKRTHVSLCSMLLDTPVRQMCSGNLYYLAEDSKGNILDINRRQLNLFIRRLNENEINLTDHNFRMLLNCVESARSVFQTTLGNESPVERQYSTETDQGFGSGGFCSANEESCDVSVPQGPKMYPDDINKIASTFQWANHQMEQSRGLYPHGPSIAANGGYIHGVPVDPYDYLEDIDESASTVNENYTKKMPTNRVPYFSRYDEVGRNISQFTLVPLEPVEGRSQIRASGPIDCANNWVPPDSDSDSETCSVLCQRTMEVNKNYMRPRQQVDDSDKVHVII